MAIVGAFSLQLDGSKPSDATLTGSFWAAAVATFLVGLIGTPLYMYARRDKKPVVDGKAPPWKVTTIIATAAFVFWAYSVGGAMFVGLGLFTPLAATIAVLSFTFLVPPIPAK